MTLNITYNEDAFPVTYECSALLRNSAASVQFIEFNFLYDLVYQSSRSVDKARQFVESTLLLEVARRYGLSDGAACRSPMEDVSIWAVRISALPVDTPYQGLSECYELVPGEGESCVTFNGRMEGLVIGSTDTAETIAFIAEELNSGAITVGSQGKFAAKFLGTTFDNDSEQGKDNLPDSLVDEQIDNPDDSGKMDPIGILLIVGIVCSVVALAAIVYRRRRRSRVARAKDSQNAVHQAHLDHDSYHSKAFSDIDNDTKSNASSVPRRDSRVFETEDGNVNVEFPPAVYPNTYSFDASNAMRSEVLGIHATGAVNSTPASTRKSVNGSVDDSDSDSWAQSEGIFGCLELQLEPMTSEV